MMVAALCFLQRKFNLWRPLTETLSSDQPSQHQLDIVGLSPSKFDGSEQKTLQHREHIKTSTLQGTNSPLNSLENCIEQAAKQAQQQVHFHIAEAIVTCSSRVGYYSLLFLDCGNQNHSAVLQSFNGTNLQLSQNDSGRDAPIRVAQCAEPLRT